MYRQIIILLLSVLSLAALGALVYIVTAKRFEDRVVGANLVCAVVLNIIAVLGALMNTSFIQDVCLVFAFLGFLAVVVLCRLLAVQLVEKHLKEGTMPARKRGEEK